jgi:hypothetical protein
VETAYDAESVVLTQMQADALVRSNGGLARAVSGLVETATSDALGTAQRPTFGIVATGLLVEGMVGG